MYPIIIIIYIILIITTALVTRKKSINKFFINKAWNKVIVCLTEQGITNLEKDFNEEEIISKVREYYKDNFNCENLNLQLIKLETLRVGKSNFMISNFNGLLVALMLGIIGWFISLSSNYKGLVFPITYIISVSLFLLILITKGAYSDLFKAGKNSRLDVSINIHKSVIQEQLKKIEEKKQQEIEKSKQVENQQLIFELKEIQKLLKCNNEDKRIVTEACNKIMKDIF